MAGTNKKMTTADIIYWLGRVLYIPQGNVETTIILTEASYNGKSTGIVTNVQRGTAISECVMPVMSCVGTASGVLEE